MAMTHPVPSNMSGCVLCTCTCVGLSLFVAVVVVSLLCCVSFLESCSLVDKYCYMHGSKFACNGCVPFFERRLLVYKNEACYGRVWNARRLQLYELVLE